jgi:predicted FMN-binding regulatory protein PaiB
VSVGTRKIYQPRDNGDIKALVDAHPLAWILCGKPEDFAATPIPVQLRCDDQGRPSMLVGHFARSNPQLTHLRENPDALVLVTGPQAYVSPSWFDDRTMAPTWNYTSVAFHVSIMLEEDPATIRRRIEDLVTAMEAPHPRPWRIADMGTRYAKLANHVVAFHAPIHAVRASFKLGQDERDDVFPDILAGLEATGERDLVTWMERLAGPERLATVAAARRNSQAPARVVGSPPDDGPPASNS